MRLPEEHPLTGTESRPLKAVVMAVAMVVALNIAMIAAGVRLPVRHGTWLIEQKWAIAGNSQQSFDYLVVGDSSGGLGINPELLSQQLGEPAANLCTIGSMGLVDDLWLVEEYLKTHQPPRAVVVIHAAEAWIGGVPKAVYQYAAALPESTPLLLRRLAGTGATPAELFITLRYRNWFPVLQLKDQLREALGWSGGFPEQAGLEEVTPAGGLTVDVSRINADQVIAHSKTYWDVADASRRSAGSLLPTNSSAAVPSHGLSAKNRDALNELIQVARGAGIHVYIVNGPVAKVVRDADSFDDRMVVLHHELNSLAASHAHVDYLLPDWLTFPATQMENANHIIGDAVDVYTKAVAAAIQQSAIESAER